jgi:hypothetical protein
MGNSAHTSVDHLRGVAPDIIQQGFDAYHDGETQLDNPYIHAYYEISYCDEKKSMWSKGWNKAHEGISNHDK